MKHTREYKAIAAFYGERAAKRSGVRLMNHIDEGLIVLNAIDANFYTKAAFCLHPLFQADQELLTVGKEYMDQGVGRVDPMVILLVMEYRHRANAFLPGKVRSLPRGVFTMDGTPTPGPIPEVRDMLIADKVQNRKDFEQFHKGTHALSVELDYYFKLWLKVLGVDENTYQALCHRIEETKP